MDESTLRRLLAAEAHRMNDGVVADGAPLHALLGGKEATVRTKGGHAHRFDPEAIRRFAAPLSPLVRGCIHVPVRFHLDHRLPGTTLVTDPVFAEALGQHGVRLARQDGDRVWLSLPRAEAFARRFPSLVQFQRR